MLGCRSKLSVYLSATAVVTSISIPTIQTKACVIIPVIAACVIVRHFNTFWLGRFFSLYATFASTSTATWLMKKYEINAQQNNETVFSALYISIEIIRTEKLNQN